MATAHEHMLADMLYLFAQDGEEVVELVIDGETCRAIRNSLEEEEGEFDGQLIYRRRYLCLADELSAVLGQERELDGKLWRVVSISRPGVLLDITFERYST